MNAQAGVSCKWADDIQHVLLEYFEIIHNSPSHIYHSALPCSPSSSWLWECYGTELSTQVKVVKGLPLKWATCFRTVAVPTTPMALSYWNSAIAVAMRSGEIIILNSVTGSKEAVFSGHTKSVGSVQFSSDGVSLVSGSADRTVKLWNVQTGGVVETFSGHTATVTSVSISADSNWIASGSEDKVIRLWNAQTGKCYHTIQQPERVTKVSFAPANPQCFISVSDKKIWEWNVNGCQTKPAYNGLDAAFSLDGTQFVLCNGEVVTVQNSESRITVAEFHLPCNNAKHCCFSIDGRFVAMAALGIAYVCNITGPHPQTIATFDSKPLIMDLTFSPSTLISATAPKSVKFWPTGTLPVGTTSGSPDAVPSKFAAVLQAKDGVTITDGLGGTVKICDISTGHCKGTFQLPSLNDRRDLQLIDGRLVVAWNGNGKINVWDAQKRKYLLVVDDPFQNTVFLKFSEDGSKVFWLGTESLQVLSIDTGEIVCELKLEYAYSRIYTDGSKVWVDSIGLRWEGWDFGTVGEHPDQLANIPPHRLHPSGTILWDIHSSKVLDASTGKVVFHLSMPGRTIADAQWNDKYLVICFCNGEVVILDFSYMFL